jgi:copper chaperone CopZ
LTFFGATENHLQNMETDMTTVTYSIPSISCGHCVHTIQSEVSELAGVVSVVADQTTHQATITFDAPATEELIKSLLAEINYPAVN